jgi:hypothetical protein
MLGWISEQTATSALYNINRLLFYNQQVFTARYSLSHCIKPTRFVFKGLIKDAYLPQYIFQTRARGTSLVLMFGTGTNHFLTPLSLL